MPLARAANAIKRKIEDGQQEQQRAGVDATRLVNQLPPATVPPASGSTRGGVTLSDATPAADGTGAPGTSAAAARGDHVHPAGGGSSLTVEEVDGSPTDSAITKIVFPNGTLGIAAHVATYTPTGGGGGNATSTGAAGSEPGSPAAGDLYLPNNGFSIERYSGSAWAPWGPIFPLTDPALQTFAWVNQGGATVTTTNGGIALYDPTVDGSNNYRVRKKSAPSTPYTITAALIATAPSVDFASFGIGFRQSSDGKLHMLRVLHNGGWMLNSLKASDASTDSASYASYTLPGLPGVIFLRIADNGTSRICSYSMDGVNFLSFHTVGRTDFLTADEVCFYANARNTTAGLYATLISWKEA